MAQGGAWTERNGPGIVDAGTPCARTSIGGDGAEQPPANLNGYTIDEPVDIAMP